MSSKTAPDPGAPPNECGSKPGEDSHAPLEAIVSRHGAMLRAHLRRHARDHGRVDDLMQECLLVAWRKLPALDRTRPIGPWLRAVAANVARSDAARSGRRARVVFDSEAVSATGDPADRSPADPGRAADAAAVRAAVAALPEHYRRVIELHYLDDMPLPDVASTLGIAYETAKKRLARGRRLAAATFGQAAGQLGRAARHSPRAVAAGSARGWMAVIHALGAAESLPACVALA